MKIKYAIRSLFIILLTSSTIAHSQKIQTLNFNFNEIDQSTINSLGSPQIQASQYKVFKIEIDSLKSLLIGIAHVDDKRSGFKAKITLPHPDGSMHSYEAFENGTMAPALRTQFPEIKSYDGYGSNGAFVKWDITPQGLHAMIMIPGQSTIFIDPFFKGNSKYYIVYYKKDFLTDKIKECFFNSDNDVLENENQLQEIDFAQIAFGSCELRTYRLAISASAEYTTFHGGTVALAQAAQVTTMNRVNGVFERDMAVRMTIIANNNLIIYTDESTDPFTNGSPGTMINENQSITDQVIGSSNYDIGHVFGTNSGGLAGLGVVCNDSYKGRGVTGSEAPIGDPFDIDYVAHEIGHQFACNHTFNNSCNGNRNNSTAVEPGSGTTIMAYAGICAPNIQNNSDDHFSGISLQEMGAFVLANGGSCPTITELTNQSPNITSTLGDITIPANTPFALTAIATDLDENTLTYNWEQMDNGISPQSPQDNSTVGPNFRSLPSSTSPTRYFPNLQDLNSGGPFTWEVLSSVSRSMNFRVTVRDNAVDGGCNDHADLTVTTDGNSGPFLIDYPSENGISWQGLSTQTVSWSVAGTDNAPVACSAVKILLSTDGGLTFPTTLASNVTNDGSQAITVPNITSTNAIVMVMCSNGTFFDISDNPFEITNTTFDYLLSSTQNITNVCQPNNAQFTIDVGTLGGYNDAVTLSITGLPPGASESFSINPIIPGNSSVFTISNTDLITLGSYTITVNASSTTGDKTIELTLNVSEGSPEAITQTTPLNEAIGVPASTSFTWSSTLASNSTYAIDIANDPSFTNIIDQATNLSQTNYTSSELANANTYYWRVRASNDCGTSSWSETFSFVTNSCSTYQSNDVGQTINEESTTSTIEVTEEGTITEIQITLLNIAHEYVGDLSATLSSPSGTVVQLFNQPGQPATEYGCDNQDILVSFSDIADATSDDFESTCQETTPAISGVFQSIDLMSNFNGESITGVWTLTVFDSYPTEDDGVLNNWSLELCTDYITCNEAVLPVVENLTRCPGSQTLLVFEDGELNDATSWNWYTESCGGLNVGSGNFIWVSPETTTTYYIIAEGGCVSNDTCSSVTVTIEDSTPPSITCTQTEIVNIEPSCLSTLEDYTNEAYAIDYCDNNSIITQSPAPGTMYSGNQTIYLTATDFSGNQDVCTIEIISQVNYSNSETACDEFFWSGVTYTESGVYSNSYITSTGCDSLATLDLTINYSSNSYESILSCDSYTWNETTYTESGNYVYSSTNMNGCDNLDSLNLNILELENLLIDGEQIGFAETDNNSYSILNSNQSSTYFWSLSNNTGTIDGGNANNSEINISWGAEDSETILCAYEKDEYDCEGPETCITIDVKRPTSIKDFEEEILSIYPNPFKNQTKVSFNNSKQSKANLKLIDSRGRIVRDYKGITTNNIIIKKEKLAEGLYYIELKLNNQISRKTIIIQ